MKWYQWLLLIPLSIFAYLQLIAWFWVAIKIAKWYYNSWMSIEQDLPEYHYLVAAIWYMWTNQILRFFQLTK